MKNIIKWLVKVIAAGILALLVASIICLVYYNPGIHITNKTGVTDYVWQSNCFESRMTEGIAWGYTDKNGFCNRTVIDKNMNILIMGSSQMEGKQVFPKQRTSYLLEELTGKTTYNIGISGHGLLTCVKNLENALTVMQPTEYVIIEIGTTHYTKEAINNCLSNNMKNIPSYDSGILFHLQKIPYLKLVYAQFKSWGAIKNDDVKKIVEAPLKLTDFPLVDAYEQLAKRISEVCITHNVQPIIVYHPHLTMNTDGTITANLNKVSLDAFQFACQVNNVIFLDMTNEFIHMYNTNHVLPHGFCNTSVGTGHLNQYGHKAIAVKLAKIISK